MITKRLNREEAEQVYLQEAYVVRGTGEEGIPQYRVVELFGEIAAIYMEDNICIDGKLQQGKDYTTYYGRSELPYLSTFLYKRGFMQIVAEHNYQLTVKAHKESEGGAIIDRLWNERIRELQEEENE